MLVNPELMKGGRGRRGASIRVTYEADQRNSPGLPSHVVGSKHCRFSP